MNYSRLLLEDRILMDIVYIINSFPVEKTVLIAAMITLFVIPDTVMNRPFQEVFNPTYLVCLARGTFRQHQELFNPVSKNWRTFFIRINDKEPVVLGLFDGKVTLNAKPLPFILNKGNFLSPGGILT